MKKNLFLFALFFMLIGGIMSQSISTFPYKQGFEFESADPGDSLPTGWTQQQVQGNVKWIIRIASGYPTGSHSGRHKAIFQGGFEQKGNRTKLITPAFDLTSLTNPTLKFWHAQRNSAGDLDELEIFYKTSSTGTWTSLKRITSEVNEYSEVSITLPEPSSEYYIAFEGWCDYGYGVHLDDVSIEDVSGIDGQAIKMYGSLAPMVGKEFQYNVRVKNLLNDTIKNYSVSILDQSNNVLATNNTGRPIASMEIIQLDFNWTPTAVGDFALRTVFHAEGDIDASTDTTPVMNVTVQPADNVFVGKIGIGNMGSLIMPFDLYFNTSLAQCIYFDHELINSKGMITELSYFNDFGKGFDDERVDTCYDKPVKIWMANTDVEELTDWIPESEFTLVFDGTKTFPQGKNQISFTLKEPFFYEGKNIIIMTERPLDTRSYDVSKGWVNTSLPDFHYRSMYYYDERTEWTENVYGHGADFHPDIAFKMTINGATVSGTVTDSINNTPMKDVLVKVDMSDGTTATRTTDENGNYNFEMLASGTHRVTVTKVGYTDIERSITVVSGVPMDEDFNLKERATYSFLGKIGGSNSNGGLDNVTVTLSGYADYSTTTDAGGNFRIDGVYELGDYQFTASHVGYKPYLITVRKITGDITINTMLSELPYRVITPIAKVVDNKAEVKWNKPTATTEFRHDNGVAVSQVGHVNGYFESVLGTVYKVDEAVLYRMSWFTTDRVPQYEVDVFVLALDSKGEPKEDSVIFTAKKIANIPMQWSEFTFPEPIKITTGFYVGIAPSNDSSYLSLGIDEPSEEYPFMENTHFQSDAFTIGAMVPFERSNIRANPLIRAEGLILPAEYTPTPSGYIVYRLIEGQNQLNWTELDEVADTTYIDTDYPTLAGGVYQYAITAKYNSYNGYTLSTPVLSTKIGSVSIVIKNNQVMEVYPNPVTDMLYINTDQTVTKIEVMDQNGRVVKYQQNNGKEMNLASLPIGMYIVRIYTESGVIPVKIMKQ